MSESLFTTVNPIQALTQIPQGHHERYYNDRKRLAAVSFRRVASSIGGQRLNSSATKGASDSCSARQSAVG